MVHHILQIRKRIPVYIDMCLDVSVLAILDNHSCYFNLSYYL